MKETAAEKFERIIHIIEAECQNSFHTKKDICELVSKKVSMSERDLNAVFIFLTDKTLREYIKERKLASAYHYKCVCLYPKYNTFHICRVFSFLILFL